MKTINVPILLIPTMALWRHAGYGRSVYYALCFVHIEHSVCHEPISVLINIYIYKIMVILKYSFPIMVAHTTR